MNKKVCGTATPGLNDKPVCSRSSSSEHCKKAISHHMPNRLIPWNPIAQVGNPTRSVEVNNLTKKVKKVEVWKQGKVSSAHHPLKKLEHHSMHWISEQKDFQRKLQHSTFVKFQFHLIIVAKWSSMDASNVSLGVGALVHMTIKLLSSWSSTLPICCTKTDSQSVKTNWIVAKT